MGATEGKRGKVGVRRVKLEGLSARNSRGISVAAGPV